MGKGTRFEYEEKISDNDGSKALRHLTRWGSKSVDMGHVIIFNLWINRSLLHNSVCIWGDFAVLFRPLSMGIGRIDVE